MGMDPDAGKQRYNSRADLARTWRGPDTQTCQTSQNTSKKQLKTVDKAVKQIVKCDQTWSVSWLAMGTPIFGVD